MAVAAHDTREDKFRWLFKPFDRALTLGAFVLVIAFALATSGWPLTWALGWLTTGLAGVMGLICHGMFRMSRAAGKL